MLSNTQVKLIQSLSTKKGRDKSGLCLVEGRKVIETAGDAIEYVFSSKDTKKFSKLVTTEAPQAIAAVARIPSFNLKDVISRDVVVVLDAVQDPGNVGAILRLCLGFDAGLILIDSADVTNPKVIRSSVGALFQVPWIQINAKEIFKIIKDLNRPVYRLENKKGAVDLQKAKITRPCVLLAGSEGQGIKINVKGTSIFINHSKKLESLNVGNAVAIALHEIK